MLPSIFNVIPIKRSATPIFCNTRPMAFMSFSSAVLRTNFITAIKLAKATSIMINASIPLSSAPCFMLPTILTVTPSKIIAAAILNKVVPSPEILSPFLLILNAAFDILSMAYAIPTKIPATTNNATPAFISSCTSI